MNRIYADSYKINANKIIDMIFSQLTENENIEYFTEEDEERIEALAERIDNIIALDQDFKNNFEQDLVNTMYYASCNSFENGLRVGLSVLENLITAEMPEIKLTRYQRTAKRRYMPIQAKGELDDVIIDYMKKVMPHLKGMQKIHLQGEMEAMLEKNVKEYLDIF